MASNRKNSNKKYNNENNNKKGNVNSKLPAGNMRTTPTDYDIPRFGFKSALVVLSAAVLSTVILPLLLEQIGFNFNLVTILANTFITGYSVAYSRFFIDTKRGFCKKFWITYVIFGISCFIISFFWLTLNTYI